MSKEQDSRYQVQGARQNAIEWKFNIGRMEWWDSSVDLVDLLSRPIRLIRISSNKKLACWKNGY